MSEPTGGWAIRDLSNLILGVPVPTPEPLKPVIPRLAGTESASSAASAGIDLDLRCEVLLINPYRDPVAAAARYADYWANRGQASVVVWIEDSGVKLQFFDSHAEHDWVDAAAESAEVGRFSESARTIGEFARRVVLAQVTRPGWLGSPALQKCLPVCALLEPSRSDLITAYESLKHVAATPPERRLSCFVHEALSARQATELATRVDQMGRQFLNREVGFAGFALTTQASTSNLVAETFISNGAGKGTTFLRALLKLPAEGLDSEPPGVERGAASAETAACPQKSSGSLGHAQLGPLPVLKVVSIPPGLRIETADQLDGLVTRSLQSICEDAVESWSIHSADPTVRLRWVTRRPGARSILVSVMDCPPGAFEQAAAQLYPPQERDEVVVLARSFSDHHRRARAFFRPRVVLFELAVLQEDSKSSLAFREVTFAE